MRLINTSTFAFEEYLDESTIPAYAILSHTWGTEEVTYQDMSNGLSDTTERKAGFSKIRLTCQQAKSEGLVLCWVDTCCIDKTSSAELSEAINSMFRWYSRSSVCYAYLSDVKVDSTIPSDFWCSRWFSRGWTLQELIAPNHIEFYGSEWVHFGSGTLRAASLSDITGIDIEVFRRQRSLNDVCVARRMSWAARRRTTRVEDVAYSLLGIFGVNMPLLYGEGERAFRRLQEQIIRDSADDSILAWDHQYQDDHINIASQLLAPSPDYFQGCRIVSHCRPIRWDDVIDLTNNGLRLKTHYLSGSALEQLRRRGPPGKGEVALLNCYREDAPDLRFALRLRKYMQRGDSGDKAYFVYPETRTMTAQDMLNGEPVGSHTRLVFVDRSGGQSSIAREINLITKRALEQQIKFTLNIALKREHRLTFKRALRLPHSCEDSSLPSLLEETSPKSGQFFEIVQGDTWSKSVSALSRPKFIIGGAKFQDESSKTTFFLLTVFQNPHVAPQWADDGDFGIMLFSSRDNTTGPHGDLRLFMTMMNRNLRAIKSKESNLELPDGSVTATANVTDFEGLMMNVTVRFTRRRKLSRISGAAHSQKKSKRLSKRLSKLRIGSSVTANHDD